MRTGAYLERVFPRKALVAMPAWEGLNRQMYPLMPFQVMVPVETLRTLVASEGAIVLRVRGLRVAVHLLHLGRVATVVALHHAMRHATD